MSDQILAVLKRTLDELAADRDLDPETRRNALKEELQFFVLNFIYHHPKYSTWIMYGGSALRIIHGLDRMSVDLDFEVSHAITEEFLQVLKKEIYTHFANTYDAEADFLTIKITNRRGLILKFSAGELLPGFPSKLVNIKIDLNHFVAPKTVVEHRPINHRQLSFIVVTYNMSALMASKLAAIFLRGTRGVGEAMYDEKGRDIYDLLWYMKKKAMPDLDYLKAKQVEEAKDLRSLFDKLTIKMNRVDDDNLRQDLLPLFTNRTFIEDWLKIWRESFLRLMDSYEIHTVTKLTEIFIEKSLRSTKYDFCFFYETENGEKVEIRYVLSDDWIFFPEGDLLISADNKLEDIMTFHCDGLTPASKNKLRQYAAMFEQKTAQYLKKTNSIVFGDSLTTKVIRMGSEDFNPKEQKFLSKSALLSCEIDDLFK